MRWRPKRYWSEEASCATASDLSLWTGADGKHNTPKREMAAKAICWGQCPVRPDCLWATLMGKRNKGIYGGFTLEERDALLRAHDGNIVEAVVSTISKEARGATTQAG